MRRTTQFCGKYALAATGVGKRGS